MKLNLSNINLPNGYTLEHHKILYSTNYEAIKLAECGAEDGTIIISDKQIKGRGRYERTWYSPTGNLYFSIIITKFKETFPLPFIAALSVGKTLEEILINNNNTTSKVEYKWPNDILVNSKKISGILLESKTLNNTLQKWIVVGIGINMYKAPTYATTIKEHNQNFTLSNLELLEKVINNFYNFRKHYIYHGFADIRNLWLKQTCHLNREITVKSYKHTYTGQFITIDTQGNMLMKQNDKTICITSGEIFNI
ncbi:biotin--[acetyl-CoA-carboxylase] ligase [Ehrlichia chaffeensis str. Liberty]|uniref:biotin--[biotin carboxyl-carrier protein] ligase n=1 Tax=Ehrlichia chaffeensis (strain ATCC CRL-10679 / Arkansas) TaxID=205920 RepID=Q2GFY9_EHRCR|nr:biotin--[acetyl-CoA-carboxylase] ligase [Ehrlichia chaffeensis]ABD45302.1 biotin--acetyl-CoA-carboxylase ligase [Ehrlichia chaffeensis str. Arkansas]AHX05376.1 biotin--[acetyl-CoA-carboxylase] ligase [Ehrlichia chaffeensis str. Jax]AHX06362.1 biotin--[acetyl-CoA-carboxylase] ligase [Ehrlichia chaffeensis str. Liberty]AHX08333.1 biotin--[acetyl-CoA-carboxylase] ligase [Ehrlichia chaffeensis str. Saint Vincent]